MLSLGLNWIQILFLALLALSFVLIKVLSGKVRRYLEKHWIIDAFYDGMMWVPLWFIGNEYLEWWVSAILVLGGMAVVAQLNRFIGTR